MGKSKLDFSGGVDLNKTDTLLNGQLSISDTSLADLFSGAGVNNLPEMAFKLTTRLGVSSSMIRFSELSLSSQDASIHGELALTGKNYSRVEFDLTGDGDNLANLIPENAVYHPAETPISVAVTGVSDLETIKVDRLQAKPGGSSLKFLGEIQIFPDWVVRNVQLNGSGPRLSELGSISSWKLVDRPFKISGLINSSAKKSLVKELLFESGKNNLSGNIRYWFDEKTPWLDLELNSSYMNLDEIRVPRTLADNSKVAIVNHGRLFSDDPLPFEMLEALSGSLSLKVDEFTLDQRYWRNLTVDASLNEGVLNVR